MADMMWYIDVDGGHIVLESLRWRLVWYVVAEMLDVDWRIR